MRAVTKPITHRKASGPPIEARGDLRVLVSADYTRRGAQVVTTVRDGRSAMTTAMGSSAQEQGAIDHGTPDRDGFGERVWEAFACARRVDENDSVSWT